uniref:ZM domain-containing protein n=1 Tax=Rhabditophanes sp. KR3021 TaxID=114890 RepID=A0AC35TYH0_9BILA
MPTTQHLQYNSPANLYSRETAEEQYRQQTAGIDTQPIPIQTAERHFDPSKSKTLEFINSGANEGEFISPEFFDKVNMAEAPRVPRTPDPVWANEARARSERARSKTPAYNNPNQGYYPEQDQNNNDTTNYNYNNAAYNKYTTQTPVDYNRQRDTIFTNGPVHVPAPEHTYSDYRHSTHASHQYQPRNDNQPSDRGYQFGGADYIDHNNPQFKNSSYHYDNTYNQQQQRSSSVTKDSKPGYQFGGTAFGSQNSQSAYNPCYRTNDAAYLNSRYEAEQRRNTFAAPLIGGVDPVVLVGDTISNQHINQVRERSDEQKKYVGTIFGPAPGRTNAHRSVSPLPRIPEPVCYATTAQTLHSLRSKSTQPRTSPFYNNPNPQYQQTQQYQSNWSSQQDGSDHKEVNVKTLLTDEALKTIRRSHTPDWSHRSHQKHVAWQNDVVDPTHLRPEIPNHEPNWSRNVNQRRNVWENKCRDAEARVQLPAAYKVPPPQTPNWAQNANQKQQVWQQAANERYSGQESNAQMSDSYYQKSNYNQSSTTNTVLPVEPPRPAFVQAFNGANNYSHSSSSNVKTTSSAVTQQPTYTSILPQGTQGKYHFSEDRHESFSRNATGEEPQHYETHSHRESGDPASAPTIPPPPILNAPAIPLPPAGVNPNVTYHYTEDKHEKYSSTKSGQEPKAYETHTHKEAHTPNAPPIVTQKTTYNYNAAPAVIATTPGYIQQSSWNKTSTNKKTTEIIEKPVPLPRFTSQQRESSNMSSSNVGDSRVSNYSKGNNSKVTTYACSGDEAFNRLSEMNETLPIGSVANTISNTTGTYKDEQGKDIQYKRELTTSVNPGKEYQLLKEQETRVVEQPLQPGIISRHVTTKYYKKKTVTDSTTTQ